MRILVDANSTKSGSDEAVALVVERDDATVGDLARALAIPGETLEIGGVLHRNDVLLSSVELVEGIRVGSADSESELATGIGNAWVGVSGGPSTGAIRRLDADGPSTVTIGRSADNDLDIENSSVSTQHALVERTAEAVTIRDLGSTNGTWIDGKSVSKVSKLRTGTDTRTVARIGSSSIEYLEIDSTDRPLGTSPSHADESGRVLFNRSPRGPVAPSPEPVAVPEALPDRKKPTLRMASLIVPVIFAVVMVQVTGRWTFALFALLSPVMALGTWISDRRTAKKERSGDIVNRRNAMETLNADLDAAEHAERVRRSEFAPNLLEVRRRVELPSKRLWERRLDSADALTVGLGVGAIPWDPTARGDDKAVEFDEDVQVALDQHVTLEEIEILADLREGPLGVVGDESRAKQVTRSALLQLATHHGPADIMVVIFTTDDHVDDWRWAQWLPHLTTAAGGVRIFTGEQSTEFASSLVDEISDGSLHSSAVVLRPAVLMVVDDLDALHRKSSPVRHLLGQTSQNIFGMVIAPVEDRLPATVATVVEVDGQDGEFERRQPAHPGNVESGIIGGVPVEVAENIARSLARFDDPESDTVGATVPTRVLPQDIFPKALFAGDETQLDAVEVIRERWNKSKVRDALTSTIGLSEAGPFELDLVGDGPHGLVAGTTGAGKSEFLRTMVLGLAANHDPDDLVFVLIDYKGGSAFDRCAALPHVVGLVTDLDEHLAERALQSLEAELHHREFVLRRSGCSDILEYRGAGSPEGSLPRLVVVIDEFATMRADLPDFIKSLVGIAQRGRSLGVHLILATQRPSGAVDANIRANTNLRVALRVQDTADSTDVIDDPGAARLDRAHPGRALVRRGEGDLVLVQSAYVSDASGRGATPLRVGEVQFAGVPPVFASSDVDGEVTNLELLVSSITEAAASYQPARRPWLEELPRHIADTDQLSALAQGDDAHVVIAVGDDPKRQRRVTRGWNLEDGHLSIIGGPGTGVTTTLRSAITALGAAQNDRPMWVFPVDHGAGGLTGIDEFGHVASVISSTDQPRQDRLLQFLSSTLDERRAKSSTTGEEPLIVLAIDGLGSFVETNDVDSGTPNGELFGRIGRDGPAVGIYLLTGFQAQNEIPRMLRTFFNQTIVLEQADERAYGDFGIRNRNLPAFVPGRALFGTEPMVAQVIDWEAAAHRGQVEIAALVEPPSMEGLSSNVSQSELPAAKVEPDLSIPFALLDRTRESASLELRVGEHGLVAGPSRSGRTNTLRVLASQLRSADPALILIGVTTTPESTLFDDGVFDAGGPLEDLTDVLASCLEAERRMVVFVDDAERIDIDKGPLYDIARTSPTHATIIATVRSSTARQGYSHWTRFVRASGTGVLLEPDQALDGELLGVRLPRGQRLDKVTGRGYLVDSGVSEVVQVAVAAQ